MVDVVCGLDYRVEMRKHDVVRVVPYPDQPDVYVHGLRHAHVAWDLLLWNLGLSRASVER